MEYEKRNKICAIFRRRCSASSWFLLLLLLSGKWISGFCIETAYKRAVVKQGQQKHTLKSLGQTKN